MAFGYANEPEGEELRTDHLFRIASHSKTFTATSIMQLVEQSKIRLDDRLCITHGKVFEANEHYKYTNVGYSLLGMAIEAASGQSYHDYVRDRIIGPLGLVNTGPEYEAGRKRQYAAGHTGLLGGAEPREAIGHIDTRGMAAATGFYSTAEDLTRYGAAHFFGNEELIGDAGKRLIQRLESTVVSNDKEQGSYGLGMDLTTIGPRQWVGHSGGYPGHITRTYIDPHGRAVVSVLTNCIGGPATRLAQGVIKLLDLAHDAPERPTAPEDVDLRRFTGWDELEVIDENRLRLVPDAGFGPVDMVRYGGGSR